MSKQITISTDFIDAADTMRQAQNYFFKVTADHSGQYTQHQRTRVLQAAKASEKRFDELLKQIRVELGGVHAPDEPHKTDEVQGTYLTELE